MPKLEKPTMLVVHCAATPNGDDRFTTKDIDEWHKARGFIRDHNRTGQYKHVGYHAVIEIDGKLQAGRDWDERGAHVRGWNHCTWGVCMVGKDKFTVEQWAMLTRVVNSKLREDPKLIAVGHRSLNDRKLCPGFDVARWLAAGKLPLVDHLFSKNLS